jgi:hypothetical protein
VLAGWSPAWWVGKDREERPEERPEGEGRNQLTKNLSLSLQSRERRINGAQFGEKSIE